MFLNRRNYLNICLLILSYAFFCIKLKSVFSIPVENLVLRELEYNYNHSNHSSPKVCNVKLDFSNMDLEKLSKNFISSPYVKELNLSNNKLTKIPAEIFDHLPNLELLDISNNKINAENFFSFGRSPNLETLILDKNEEVDYELRIPRDLKISSILPSLRSLYLRNIFLDNILIDWEEYLPDLTSLDLSSSTIIGIENLIKKFPSSLKHFTLENVNMQHLDISLLTELESLNLNKNNFEELYIGDNFDEDLKKNAVYILDSNNLKELSLSNCKIKQVVIRTSLNQQPLHNLIFLDLSYNSITSLDIDEYSTYKLLDELKILNLSNNPLLSLMELCNFKKVETLILDDIPGDFEQLFHDLFSICNFDNLKKLSVRNNHMDSIRSEIFENVINLEEIDLSKNQLKLLPQWGHNAPLKRVHLKENFIHNLDYLQFDDVTSLELLDLRLNPISTIKILSLKSLPDNATLLIGVD